MKKKIMMENYWDDLASYSKAKKRQFLEYFRENSYEKNYEIILEEFKQLK